MSSVLFGFNTLQKKNLIDYINLVLGNLQAITVQHITATEGGTVNILPTSEVITVVVDGPSEIDNLHFNFPGLYDTSIGSIIRIASMITVNNVTMNGSNIMNPTTALFPNDCDGFQKIGDDSWIKII